MKVRSVETAIITGRGLDTPPHQKSLKANRQNITRDIFQPTTKQWWDLWLLQSCPTAVQGQWTRWMNYVQQDFCWASLMAMPANLTFFCLASTYNTLPSPTNLKRWRITTETMCTLCSKDVCTTAHILGACKVSLLQGRYTFRHDSLASSHCRPQNFHFTYKRNGAYFC